MKLKLSDVLDNLTAGELSLKSIVNAETGEISMEDVNKKVLPILNAGLGDIHSQFFLKRKEVWIRTCPGKTRYVLDKSSTRSMQLRGNGGGYVLSDKEDPFFDDIVEILSIEDDCGKHYRLNVDTTQAQPKAKGCSCGHRSCQVCYEATLDYPATITTRSPYGCNSNLQPLRSGVIMTPGVNIIRVPDDMGCKLLKVTYKATPRRLKKIIDDGLYDPSMIDIDLPYAYLNALIYYIASRFTNANMLGVNQNYNEGNNYYQKYISACAMLVDRGIDVDSVGASSDRFSKKGFR